MRIMIGRVGLLGATICVMAMSCSGKAFAQDSTDSTTSTQSTVYLPPPSCKKIRREINRLVTGQPVIQSDAATGERKLLNAEEREEALKQAQDQWASRCDPQQRTQGE
ncbi:MAG: hypothetical protein H6970_05990 [Gammaproteobacteria bacterium]|nr:hypothetical protein [Gammaproteobacteria bacterium]